MLFGNDDDDADFTVQPGSSRLASLFSDNEAARAGNSSLTYTPPKQPSVGKASDKQSSSGTLSLLHAAAVQAFKYEGKKPSNLGRLGIAVLGNHEKGTYKLILYKEKQQQVAVTAINAQFTIRLPGNNFLSFADEKRCNWSVKFDNEEGFINFLKQAVVAKALSFGGSLTELGCCICQDLVVPGEGDGDSLVHGSSAVIKYTAWLLTSEHSLKKVFDTADSDEPQKIKIGRGKHVKGLEEGLLGCRKNSRKLLVLPPSFGYGSKGLGTTVPPNSVLVYDVSVISVSRPKSGAKDSTPRSSTPVSVAAVGTDQREARSSSHGSADEPARSRAPSAPPDWPPQQQQPATAPSPGASGGGESDKARLLSRMAKIGAQMLPMPGAVPAQPSSDSEVEDERLPSVQQVPVAVPLPQPAVREGSPKPVVKPRSFSQQSSGDAVLQPTPMQPALHPMVSAYTPGLPPAAAAMPAAQHMALYQAQTQLAQGALAGYPYQQQGILLPPPHTYPAAPVPTSVSTALDAQLPVLLSETRSQNTEVRLNIAKLTDKVDCIIGKLDTLRSQPPSAPPLSSYVDSEALLHNIQRIVQENVKLKNESSEKNSKIQALNEKICDLLQRNQRLMEESNTMFEQRSDTLHNSAALSQARLVALETEKMKVSDRLDQALCEVSLLRAELSERQRREDQTHKGLAELQCRLQDNQNMLQSLEDSLKEAEQEKKHLERQIEGYRDAACATENAAHSSEQIAQLEESISAHWKSVCDTETGKLSARISSLEGEKETLSARVMELDSKCKELEISGEKQRQAYEDRMRQLQQENEALSTGAASSASAALDFDTELKKIMNTLFKFLQREFSHQETYSSKEAKGIVLNSIRDYTTAVLERRQASAAFGNGTSGASPTSTSSNSGTASPAAASTAEATPSQPQQSNGGGGNQEEKHENGQESPEAQPAVEKPSRPSGPSGPGQHDERAAPAPEEVHAEAGSNEVAEPGLPQEAQDVAPTGDEKAADRAKEGASGDAQTSSPSSESKTEAESQAESKNAQPPDWSWKPQPPPPPLFDEYEDDDWLN